MKTILFFWTVPVIALKICDFILDHTDAKKNTRNSLKFIIYRKVGQNSISYY